jgi:hypothetical protein
MGLANLLATWARCLVQSERYGLIRIRPTWPQICRQPWLRNFPDKRTYHDLFVPSPDEINGAKRLTLLATHRRVPEEQLGLPIPQGSIVAFRGMKGFLEPVLGHRDLVRRELYRIIRPQHTRAVQQRFSPEVAIHVRLGDFGPFNPGATNLVNTRIDLQWYMGILTELRRHLGPLSASVFSDGTDQELAPLLAMEDVSRITFGSGIADIVALS